MKLERSPFLFCRQAQLLVFRRGRVAMVTRKACWELPAAPSAQRRPQSVVPGLVARASLLPQEAEEP